MNKREAWYEIRRAITAIIIVFILHNKNISEFS